MILLPPQMYREFHLSICIAKKMHMKMKTRVPRNLFGAPERKEGMHLLQESLEQERARFQKRWSVDPLAEDDDKENGPRPSNTRVTPKKRSSPYAKQTSIHDYWRSRKIYDPSKKSPDAAKTQLVQPSAAQMQSLSLPPAQAQQPAPLADSLSEAPIQSAQEAQPVAETQLPENQLENVQPSTN